GASIAAPWGPVAHREVVGRVNLLSRSRYGKLAKLAPPPLRRADVASPDLAPQSGQASSPLGHGAGGALQRERSVTNIDRPNASRYAATGSQSSSKLARESTARLTRLRAIQALRESVAQGAWRKGLGHGS